jgi:rabenosyn-5
VRGIKSKKEEIRSAEQAIVKWEDDAGVTRCPICSWVHPGLLSY